MRQAHGAFDFMELLIQLLKEIELSSLAREFKISIHESDPNSTGNFQEVFQE